MKRSETVKRFNSGKGLKLSVLMIMAIFGVVVSATIPVAQADTSNPNPGVLPPDSEIIYKELSAKWWQWALSIPAASNPVLDTTGEFCAEGQSGPIWFLAGTFGGSAKRTCTVPVGKALFFPVLNTAWGAPADCDPGPDPNNPIACDVETLRAEAAKWMDANNVHLKATIDGVEVQNLLDYRAQSPVFSYFAPEGNVFGIPSGTYEPLVSDGYWLMVVPPTTGEHIIYFKGATVDPSFETEVTYTITVK